MRCRAAFLLSPGLLPLVFAANDVGYEYIATSSPEEFENRCAEVPIEFPPWSTGDFIISSTGLYEMGSRKFTGMLDAFGKLHRFTLGGRTVCATSRIMSTAFHNNSKKEGTIAAGLLFSETYTPRQCPIYNPLCNLLAPNDNSYVQTYSVGGELFSTTDSNVQVTVDPVSLNVTGNFQVAKLYEGGGKINYLSSAHPVRHPDTGEWVEFRGSTSPSSDKTTITTYRMSGPPSVAANRHDFSKFTMETPPYMHSFGITDRYLVFPHMPVKFGLSVKKMMKTMGDDFEEIAITSDSDPNNAFHVAPLNGSEPTIYPLPASHKLYYTHTANSYENDTGIVIDITLFNTNPFTLDLGLVETQLNKTARDRSPRTPTVTRFLLPWNKKTPVTSETLSNPLQKTEFPKINPLYARKKHCFYWANTWFNDLESYGSMAVVKYDLCTGGKMLQWARPNWYPSEPFMIPSREVGAAEDDGFLLMTATDGTKGEASFLVLDAKTLGVVAEVAHFPHLPYTAHGAFYEQGTWAAQGPAAPQHDRHSDPLALRSEVVV
jgi:carotenoid cleavage dioxygenase-like enzyme